MAKVAAKRRSARSKPSEPVICTVADLARILESQHDMRPFDPLTEDELRRCVTILRDGEALAGLFHVAYEKLAPRFGYATRTKSAVPWDRVPEPNRSLMIATAREVAYTLLSGKSARSTVPQKE